MMAQFLEIKHEYPAALLFYRMGDFYELFFDDAVAAAQALDITLTRRGKHLGEDIPMCGVPVHAAEGYLLNLIRKGFRVAVCEQLENPKEAKKRGAKSIVKRGVVRLVTPGTLTEDTLLHSRQSNFLAAFAQVRDQSCLAWLDISTGDVRYSPCSAVRLGPELARLEPAEVLISDTATPEFLEIISGAGAAATPLSQSMFDSVSGMEQLSAAFGVKTLKGFGDFGRADIAALGALIEYLNSTLKSLENNIKIKKVLRPIIHKENKKGEKYVIIADTLQESQTKDGEVKLENSLTTINKNGILTEIIAGYAIITNNYEDFNLTKKVTIIKKSRDFELKTNSLIGSMKKGNFFTNDKVFIVSGNITILGAGMDLKRNGEYIKIRGKAKLVMLLSKNNEN